MEPTRRWPERYRLGVFKNGQHGLSVLHCELFRKSAIEKSWSMVSLDCEVMEDFRRALEPLSELLAKQRRDAHFEDSLWRLARQA